MKKQNHIKSYALPLLHRLQKSRWLLLSFVLLIAIYTVLYIGTKRSFLGHEPYDSYTLQSLRWWQGYVYLKENISFLEIAIYKDHYFVSFPPFPSVIMAIFTPFFGQETPSNLINTFYALFSYLFLVRLFCLRHLSYLQSILWAFFLVFGSNILWMSIHAGVWFQAQCLSFCLSCAALCLLHEKMRWQWGLGVALIACAVLCRPLQVVFFPVVLLLLWQRLPLKNEKRSLQTILPFCIAPIVIALIAGWYNYVRFDNPLEFGHHYLPGFKHSPHGLFHWKYLAIHAVEIMRLPEYKDGRITFPLTEGFAFWLANPFYTVFLVQLLWHGWRRRFWSPLSTCLVACIGLNIFLTMCHDTMGMWQFGLRYFVDALPFIGFLVIITRAQTSLTPTQNQSDPSTDSPAKMHPLEIFWMTLAVFFQAYGTFWLFNTP
jgi:hypothetical protein